MQPSQAAPSEEALDPTILGRHLLQHILLQAAKRDPYQLQNAAVVCTAWRDATPAPAELRVSHGALSERRLGVHASPVPPLIAWLQRCQRGRSLQSLSIRVPPSQWGCTSTPQHAADAQFLLALLDAVQLPRLRRLELGAGWDVSADSLRLLGARLPHLTGISIMAAWEALPPLGPGVVLALSQHLTQLALCSSSLDDDDVAAIARLTRLCSLGLCCASVDDDDMAVLAGALTRLTYLCVHGNWSGSAGVGELAQLTALASLDIAGCQLQPAAVHALAAALTGVTHLSVADCNLSGGAVSALASMTQLRSLDFSRNGASAREAVAALAPSLTRLTSLVACSNGLGEREVAALAQLAGLRVLDIRHSEPGFSGMRSLASALTQLESLSVFASTLGAEAAGELLALTGLRALDASGVNISDALLRGLASTLTHLTTLSVECSEATSESILALSQLSRLQRLCICTLRDLALDSVVALVGALPDLLELSVTGCDMGDAAQVTSPGSGGSPGAAHAHALAALTQVTSLSLDGERLGMHGVQALAGLTQLRSLSICFAVACDEYCPTASLTRLQALTRLTSLCVWGWRTTPQEQQALQAALPGVYVYDSEE